MSSTISYNGEDIQISEISEELLLYHFFELIRICEHHHDYEDYAADIYLSTIKKAVKKERRDIYQKYRVLFNGV